jgi:4-carboxymuconolactone decarboxylase
MSRLPPLDVDALTPEQTEIYNRIASGARGGVRGPFTALLHSPALAGLVEQLGVYLRYRCAVPERLRELVILIVASRWQCDYEWFAHAPLARRIGHGEEVISAIGRAEVPDMPDVAETAVLRFARALVHEGTVDQPTYSVVSDFLGEQGTVDLGGLVGYYTLLAMTLNAHQVAAPPDADIPWRQTSSSR